MLRWRLLLGALLIAALVGLLWLDMVVKPPGLIVFVLALVAGALAAHEMASLVTASGHEPLLGVIYGGNLLVIGSNAIPLFCPSADDQPIDRLGWPLIAFAVSVLAAFVGEISRYREPGKAVVNLGLAVLGIGYVGVMLSFALQLRMLGGPTTGMVALAALLLTVKLGDTGAYTVGRLIGRHKMAPSLSPGKTMEGAVGAIAFACLGAWFALTQLPVWMHANPIDRIWAWPLFGVAVGTAGLLGDLAESLLKRDVGVKDSSAWMPGFGGVLDMVDSILFAAPVAYLCALWDMT